MTTLSYTVETLDGEKLREVIAYYQPYRVGEVLWSKGREWTVIRIKVAPGNPQHHTLIVA